jgi:hypothetical protein
MIAAPHGEQRVQMPHGLIRRAPGVIAVAHAGNTVLLAGSHYFELSERVASRIWALLGNGIAVDHLIERIEEEFAAPREVVAKDVTRFLTALLRNRLIEVMAGRDGRGATTA